MLVLGYALAVATFIGFVIAPANLVVYGVLFAMCGIFIAAEDTLESALAGEMVEEESRALGFGAFATMNGVGDLVSSVMIGFIWAFVGYSAGFIVAAVIAAAGTILLIWTTRGPRHAPPASVTAEILPRPPPTTGARAHPGIRRHPLSLKYPPLLATGSGALSRFLKIRLLPVTKSGHFLFCLMNVTKPFLSPGKSGR